MPDPDVQTRLHAALGSVRHEPVDTTALVQGAIQGAVRLRRRRAAAAALTVTAAIALPLGLASAQQGLWPARDSGRPGAAPAQDVQPAAPSSGAATSAAPAPVPWEDAAAVLLTAADLPQGLALDGRSSNAPHAVPGQRCSGPTVEPAASQTFVAAPGSALAGVGLTTAVTEWSQGSGSAAYQEVEQNTGTCTIDFPVEEASWTPASGQEGILRRWEDAAEDYVVAVTMVQDVMVAVRVNGPRGDPRLEQLARDAADAVVARVRAQG